MFSRIALVLTLVVLGGFLVCAFHMRHPDIYKEVTVELENITLNYIFLDQESFDKDQELTTFIGHDVYTRQIDKPQRKVGSNDNVYQTIFGKLPIINKELEHKTITIKIQNGDVFDTKKNWRVTPIDTFLSLLNNY